MVRRFNTGSVRDTSVNQFENKRITRTQVRTRRNQPSVKKQEIYAARSSAEEKRESARKNQRLLREKYENTSLATTEEFYQDLALGYKVEIERLVSYLANGEDIDGVERNVTNIRKHVRRYISKFEMYLEDSGNSLGEGIAKIQYLISEKRWSRPLFDETLDLEDSKYFDMARDLGYEKVA